MGNRRSGSSIEPVSQQGGSIRRVSGPLDLPGLCANTGRTTRVIEGAARSGGLWASGLFQPVVSMRRWVP